VACQSFSDQKPACTGSEPLQAGRASLPAAASVGLVGATYYHHPQRTGQVVEASSWGSIPPLSFLQHSSRPFVVWSLPGLCGSVAVCARQHVAHSFLVVLAPPGARPRGLLNYPSHHSTLLKLKV
jgi:hypothetical protein